MGEDNNIVVTGIGVFSALGRNFPEFIKNAREGYYAKKPIERFAVNNSAYYNKSGCQISFLEGYFTGEDPSKIATIAIHAAKEALAQANLDLENISAIRKGVSMGTSHGGNHALTKYMQKERQGESHYDLLFVTSSTISGLMAKTFGFMGPNLTVSTACSSSTTSVGLAMDALRFGRADVMLAGGADLFSELTFSGFSALKAIASADINPLSQERSGLLLGEGAAVFVLENLAHAKARGATILAHLPGYAIANEAYHETAPNPSGENAAYVMGQALNNAALKPEQVEYINLHGTGTQANDPMELNGVLELFGDHAKNLCMSSSKSMLGHALGAAGALELALTIGAMNQDFLPPTINWSSSISGFENLDVIPNLSREQSVTYSISNSFAFAGHLASIVIKKPRAHNQKSMKG